MLKLSFYSVIFHCCLFVFSSEKTLAGNLCPQFYFKELKLSPSPDEQVSIDSNEMAKWVGSHSSNERVFAAFLAKNIRLVTMSEFESNLTLLVNRYLTINRTKIILVSGKYSFEKTKSGAWVSKLIEANFPREPFYRKTFPADIVKIKEMLSADPESRVLLVDDASYSGTQIKIDLETLRAHLGEQFERVDVLIPFVSTQAYQRIVQQMGVKDVSKRVFIGEPIPSIQEMMTESNVREAEESHQQMLRFLRLGGSSFETKKNIGWLTVFAHKLPDDFSFPSILAEGLISGQRPTKFIRAPARPIYKSW